MPSQKSEAEKLANLIRDAGGELVGRTRLQKVAYLLEITGLGDGFSFEYRRFGPFSEDLASAVREARALRLIDEADVQAAWGGHYSVFRLLHATKDKSPKARLQLAQAAAEADAVELELAATAAFLSQETDDPWRETAERKADKAAGGRIDRAKSLYRTLSEIKTPKRLPDII